MPAEEDPVKLYLSNLLLWACAWPAWIREAKETGTIMGWWMATGFYVLDIGTNAVFGGDPRTSISLRVWRDRRDNVFAQSINWIANLLFHKGGPPSRLTNPYGEGKEDDRGLDFPQQGVAIAFGFALYWSLLASIFRLDFDLSVPILIWRVASFLF